MAIVTFLSGPASNANLELQRTPIFLRVVIDPDGKVDALDQLDDAAAPAESIYVYVFSSKHGGGFVCSRGRGGGCRSLMLVRYRFFETQPADEILRDNARWAAWATEQAAS